MNFRLIIEMLVKYLPDLIECLSKMPEDRRMRLLSMLEDERARSLLLRLLQREAESKEFQSLLADIANRSK